MTSNARIHSRREVFGVLMDFEAMPGRYPIALREPRILFDNAHDILVMAAGRNLEGLALDPQLEERVRHAARFFVRMALLRPGVDYYTMLGLEPGFDAATLREHYRLMIRMTHPDFAAAAGEPWPADAATRINLANDVLSSPVRKHAYDASLPKTRLAPAPAVMMRPMRPPMPVARERRGMPLMDLWKSWPPAQRRTVASAAAVVAGVAVLVMAWPGAEHPADAVVASAPMHEPAAAEAKPALPAKVVAPPAPPVPAAVVPAPVVPVAVAPALPVPPVPKAAAPVPAPVAAVAAAPSKPEVRQPAPVAPVPVVRSAATVNVPDVATRTASRAVPESPVRPAPVPSAAPTALTAPAAVSARAPVPAPAAPPPAVTRSPAVAPAVAEAPVAVPVAPQPAIVAPVATVASPVAVASVAAPQTPVAPAVQVVSATPRVTMAEVQPTLANVMAALQSGRGEEVVRLLDRSARRSEGADNFVRTYNRFVAGNRVVRLGQAQFRSRMAAEHLVVDGAVQLHLQDENQRTTVRDLHLRAYFLSRDGGPALTELVASGAE